MTSLAYIAAAKKRALVVCPKRVLGHWVREANTAFPTYYSERTLILDSSIQTVYERGLVESLLQARLVCINYEQIQRFWPKLEDAGLDTIILDESHRIKNPKAKRTQMLLKVQNKFQHHILLSGTPIKNRVEEFQTQFRFIGYEGADEIAEMSPGKLWNTLAGKNIYLRRNMADEFPHLKFKDPEICEVSGVADELEEIPGFDTQMQDPDGNALFKYVFEQLSETAMLKAPRTAEFCANVLHKAVGDKMIVFTERIDCAILIHNSLEQRAPELGALLHFGKLSDSERESLVQQFQDPNSGQRVLVTTRQSMAEGINLQCANRVLFNDLPWTPADISQAAARTKRLNQRKEVSEYWVVADTNFDQNLMDVLREKLMLTLAYTEGKNISEDDKIWMNKRVTLNEIIYGPEFRKKGGKACSSGNSHQ